MQKKIVKKYAELMHHAQQATGRKEAVELAIKKALDSLPNRLDKTTQENLVTQSINNIEVN